MRRISNKILHLLVPVFFVTVSWSQTVQNPIVQIERLPGTGTLNPVPPAAVPPAQVDPQVARRTLLAQRFPGRKITFPGMLPSKPATEPYAIGIEDELKVIVWPHADLTVEVVVRPDGKVSLPAIGEVQAAGIPIAVLEANLTTQFGSFFRNPKVTILPVRMNSRKVFFAGRLRAPALVVLKRTQTLLETMTEVSIMDDADLAESYILRQDLVIPVDLVKLLDGDVREDVVLEPLDTIVLPAMDKEVFVLGEVGRPGKLRVSRRADVLDALSQAGGPTEKAYVQGAYVVRNGQYVPLNMERLLSGNVIASDLSLQSGDLVFLPNAEENKVYVIGEVNSPGPVSSSKPMSLVDAIAGAGGFNSSASTDSVRVVRGNPADPTVIRVDMKQLLKGKPVEPVQVFKGDIIYVPPSGLASWNRFASQILPGFAYFFVAEALNRAIR